ncbi:GNAT family N-acetyltransferase [Candidatus Bipolaricaulota bacterium]|nr:GNAT family N-acetyltransferase [Candidatus Bipolaricaulota bacterium]
MNPITYRTLEAHEIPLICDIDRTEQIGTGYRVESGKLIRMDVVWDAPPWFEKGSEHSFPYMIHALEEDLACGGVILGAFDADRLAGIASFRPHLTETMAQLSLLHVSNGYRRQGIAAHLFDQVETLVRQSGAQQLYVSATPSGSAVGFYLSRGCILNATPHPQLLELEPEDIHMIKML